MIPDETGTTGERDARPHVSVSSEIRGQLIRLSGSRRTRLTAWTPARPTHWAPASVIDPQTGDPFTEESAWEFVIAALEDGEDIELVTLEKPPGKKGYVMKLPGNGGCTIYVKLQLGGGVVIGRSFHVSDR